MRLLVLSGLLLFLFFVVPATGAGTPASCFLQKDKKEARFSATRSAEEPTAEKIHPAQHINTATQLRRHLSMGGIEVSTFPMCRLRVIASLIIIPAKEAFCIPMALRLLFPRHYFW